MHYKVIRLSEIKEALGKNISDWREVGIFMMSEKISARDENLN